MKKIILTLAAAAMMGAVYAQEGYKITGTVDDVKDGTVYLFRVQNRSVDTVNQAALKDGKFVMTGEAGNGELLTIVVGGTKMLTPIFLENTTFTAKLNTADKSVSVVEGGEQALYREYAKIGNAINEEYRRLGQKLQQAQSKEEASAIQKEMNGLDRKRQGMEAEFIKAHPDDNLSAWIVNGYTGIYMKDYILKLYNLLSDKGKATPMGKEAWENYQLRVRTDAGQTMPDYTVLGTQGKEFNMLDSKAQLKVIVFWQSTNETCRKYNQILLEMYKTYRNQGLEVIGISTDRDKEAWEKAVWDDKLPWVQGIAEDPAVLEKFFGIDWYPTGIFLLDENNKIITKQPRPESIKANVAELL